MATERHQALIKYLHPIWYDKWHAEQTFMEIVFEKAFDWYITQNEALPKLVLEQFCSP